MVPAATVMQGMVNILLDFNNENGVFYVVLA
jgi:hypothetical protein